jgi:oligopeptide transport system substrate-binding protein
MPRRSSPFPAFVSCFALAGTLVLLVASGCAKRETPVEAGIRTHTLLLGNQAEPADLDPQIATAYTDQNILMALFEGLTSLDEKTSLPVPAAAERWDISPDALTYTFHLRAGARWSNGDPVTAQDFVYSFQRILSPKLASEYSYMLWPIKNAEAFNTGKLTDFSTVGVAATDARTLRLTLERPTPYLLALAAHPTWFPVHRSVIEQYGRMDQRSTAWTRPGHLVGNGPFTLTAWTPNARIVVTKNPRYWDAAHTTLERVVFFPTENPDVEERDFRAGQLHLTFDVPVSKISVYRERAPAQLRLDPFLQTFFFRFNVTRPPFDRAPVRRAFALAIDRDAIARHVLGGSRLPATHLTPDNCAGYTARAHVPTDPDAARRLLAEAGFPGGQGLPPIELQVRNDDIMPKVAEAIQAMWRRELGVTVSIAPFEQKTWIQNQQTLHYAVALSGWAGDYVDPVTFLGLFVSGGGNNWTGWANADYDRLIDDAAHESDRSRRYECFQQAEKILLGEAPITPLYFGTRTYLIHPAVKNWEPSLLGFHRYQLVRLEP